MTDFHPDALITNAPINYISYRRTRRLRFLFAALRTRSMAAREQMARIATKDAHGFNELISLMQAQLAGQDVEINVSLRRRRAIADLGWLCANQPTQPDPKDQSKGDQTDLELARLIYAWVLKYQPFTMKSMHRMDAVMLGLIIQDDQLVALSKKPLAIFPWPLRFLPRRLKTKPALGLAEFLNIGFVFGFDFTINPRLMRVDIKNPFRGKLNPEQELKENKSWLNQFSKALLPRSVAPLKFTEGPTVFDSLAAADVKPVVSNALVSVVMSCYKPNQALISSIQSVLASSYQNIEVVVVDDASGVEYETVLLRAEALDPRVRVLRQKDNGGTYRIRNRVLQESRGDLITFHDSDDWMHPQRIELQVKRLASKKRIANISMSTRVTENLECAESSRRYRVGLCEPSLMFWKKEVVNKIGYFDKVRKGADSEYRKRIQVAFGQELEVIEPYRALTLQRADHGGLTDGDLTFRWIADFRLAYRDSYNYFHKTTNRLYVQPEVGREFYAPRPMRFSSSLAYDLREFDLVLGANLHDPKQLPSVMKEIKTAHAANKRVGLWHIPTMFPLALPRSIRSDYLQLLDSGKVQLVVPRDKLKLTRLRLVSPSAYLISYQHEKYNWQVKQIEIVPLADSAETWVAQGPLLDELIEQRVFSDLRPGLKEAEQIAFGD